MVKTIDDFPVRDSLDLHVGLVFIELTQPVDKEIQLAGVIGIRIVRRPAEVQQSAMLTNAIRELFRRGIRQPRAVADTRFSRGRRVPVTRLWENRGMLMCTHKHT